MSFNPTAFYNLNGNSIDDISANNGANTSVTWVTGLKGQAASFNGSTSNILINDSNNFNFNGTDFFVSCWIKRGDISRQQYVLGQNNSGGTDISVIINITASNLIEGYIFNSINASKGVTSASAITDTTTWHNIIFTRSGNTLYLYIDGVLSNSFATGVFTINNSGSNFGIGQTGAYPLNRFNGLIDMVHIEKQSAVGLQSKIYNGGLGMPYPFNINNGFLNFFIS